MTSERRVIDTAQAPAAIGPYSQGVFSDGLLFCSGQIPLDPSSGDLSGSDAGEQARRCLQNLEAVCIAAGTELARAVKVTVYLRDMADFAAVNEVYAEFFPVDPPARAAIAVAGLPREALVEVEAVVAGRLPTARRDEKSVGSSVRDSRVRRLFEAFSAQCRDALRSPGPYHP